LRKAAIFFAILVVLVVAILGLAPQFVDLERFKGPIAEELLKRTGRKVELRGPITITLLPRPALTARCPATRRQASRRQPAAERRPPTRPGRRLPSPRENTRYWPAQGTPRRFLE